VIHLTVSEALEAYRREAGPRYARRIERWLEWGGRPDEATLSRYLRHLRDHEHLSDSTIDLHLRTIRAFYRRFGIQPPTLRSWRFDPRSSQRPALDSDLVQAIVLSAKQGQLWPWHVPLVLLSTIYGMRSAEMAQLRPDDLDLANDRVFIRTAKGGVQRWVYLPPLLHPHLLDWVPPSLAEVERAFAEVWSAVSDVPKPPQVGWHAIRRALVRDLRAAHVPEEDVIRFLRWRGREGSARMLDLYEHPNVLVHAQGAAAVVEGDQGSRAYDAAVWDRHPYLPFWS